MGRARRQTPRHNALLNREGDQGDPWGRFNLSRDIGGRTCPPRCPRAVFFVSCGALRREFRGCCRPTRCWNPGSAAHPKARASITRQFSKFQAVWPWSSGWDSFSFPVARLACPCRRVDAQPWGFDVRNCCQELRAGMLGVRSKRRDFLRPGGPTSKAVTVNKRC